MSSFAQRIVIIGGGVAGSSTLRSLSAHAGALKTLLEAETRLGGRTGARSVTITGTDAEVSFDSGAQYFTARSPAFKSLLCEARREAWVAPYQDFARIGAIDSARNTLCFDILGQLGIFGRTLSVNRLHGHVDRYVGVPEMYSLCEGICVQNAHTEVRCASRVSFLRRDAHTEQWLISLAASASSVEKADIVLLATSPQDVLGLLSTDPSLEHLHTLLKDSIQCLPTWSVALTFEESVALPFDGAFINVQHESEESEHGSLGGKALTERFPFSWIARKNVKPGRADAECWVLHGSSQWSKLHQCMDKEEVIASFTDAFRSLYGELNDKLCDLPTLLGSKADCWSDAIPVNPRSETHLYDPALCLGICGDYWGGPRVEGAYLSGKALGDMVARSI